MNVRNNQRNFLLFQYLNLLVEVVVVVVVVVIVVVVEAVDLANVYNKEYTSNKNNNKATHTKVSQYDNSSNYRRNYSHNACTTQ
jgi:hypothetical protein